MKSTDKGILIGVLAVIALIGFYLMVLAPKREEAAKLGADVSELESQVKAQEDAAIFAEQARDEFPKYYGRMVTLGKAVPEEADSASLLVQLNSISEEAGTDFTSLSLSQGGAGISTTPAAPVTPAPTTEAPPADAGGEPPAEGTPTGAAPTATGVVAPATEAGAANIPVGAIVGPAGLPTLPYELSFTGSYFQVADFVGGLDKLIDLRESSGQVSVDGRLMTVDGFNLSGAAPVLSANFAITTYTTPSDQGATLGASPTGPAPAGTEPQLTQTSSVTP